MRCLKPLALLLLISPASMATANDLFSEVAVESVFSGASAKNAASAASSTTTAKRITGAGQLGELVRSLGHKPERIDSKTVLFPLSHGAWSIPTSLRAAVDRGQVDITMGISTADKEAKWQAEQLLELLTADAGPASFAYNAERGQIQIRQSVSARDLTADRLGQLITEMAEIAASRESSWTPQSGAKPSAKASIPSGTWLAKPAAGEAFALRLQASGGFTLAYVKAGQTVRSTGKAVRSGSTLTLAGTNGTTLAGTISDESGRGFTVTLNGGRRLAFTKAG